MYYQGHLYITPTAFQALKDRPEDLSRELAAVGRELQTVREPGKRIENGSWELAHRRQLGLEHEIHETSRLLRSVRLIKRCAGHRQRVEIGSSIELKAIGGKERRTFRLVGSLEADPAAGLISDRSPVGRALLGKRVGQSLLIGNGHKIRYKITAIS